MTHRGLRRQPQDPSQFLHRIKLQVPLDKFGYLSTQTTSQSSGAWPNQEPTSHDQGTVRRVRAGIDECLQQGAAARNEYYQAGRSPQARCSEGLGHDGQPSCV